MTEDSIILERKDHSLTLTGLESNSNMAGIHALMEEVFGVDTLRFGQKHRARAEG